MTSQNFLGLLVLLASNLLAAQEVHLSLSGSTFPVVDSGLRLTEVRDLRVLGQRDPHALGAVGTGLFETRTALRSYRSVAEEVDSVLRPLFGGKSAARGVRVEILALDVWTEPIEGPDPARWTITLRLVGTSPGDTGLLGRATSRGERSALLSVDALGPQIRESLVEAVRTMREGGFSPPGTPIPIDPIPIPNAWTDPRRPVAPATERTIRRTATAGFFLGLRSTALLFHCDQVYERRASGWNRGEWASLSFRAPWDEATWMRTWVGEVAGGLTWQRRLGDGASRWALVVDNGAALGWRAWTVRDGGTDSVPRFERRTGPYLGVVGGAGMRLSPPGAAHVLQGGLETGVRFPGGFQLVDLALVLRGGMRF